MTRFNITIILACVLLAMLLWIVRSTVGEWTNPEPLIVLEEAPEVIEFDPACAVRRVTSFANDVTGWWA